MKFFALLVEIWVNDYNAQKTGDFSERSRTAKELLTISQTDLNHEVLKYLGSSWKARW